MARANFIKLTTSEGWPRWVNLEHIASIMRHGTLTQLNIGATIYSVQETPEEIMDQGGYQSKVNYVDYLRWRSKNAVEEPKP